MIEESITAFQCSDSFGNPSGHSFNSPMVSLVLFLDLCHGYEREPTFVSTWKYRFGLLLATYWAILIPASRYALGVHSLD